MIHDLEWVRTLQYAINDRIRDEIRCSVKKNIWKTIRTVLAQIGMLLFGIWLDKYMGAGLATRSICIAITVFNVAKFVFVTAPKTWKLYKKLRGYRGWILKNIFGVIWWQELIHFDILFAALVWAIFCILRMSLPYIQV